MKYKNTPETDYGRNRDKAGQVHCHNERLIGDHNFILHRRHCYKETIPDIPPLYNPEGWVITPHGHTSYRTCLKDITGLQEEDGSP